MKAITIHQPWAELIASGEKLIENRFWSTNYRGPIAIHAGLSRERLDYYEPLPEKMDFGAVIAIADLVDCVPLDKVRGQRFAEGPFCWLLGNVRRLPTPVKCRGLQKLWDWTPPENVKCT